MIRAELVLASTATSSIPQQILQSLCDAARDQLEMWLNWPTNLVAKQ